MLKADLIKVAGLDETQFDPSIENVSNIDIIKLAHLKQ